MIEDSHILTYHSQPKSQSLLFFAVEQLPHPVQLANPVEFSDAAQTREAIKTVGQIDERTIVSLKRTILKN